MKLASHCIDPAGADRPQAALASGRSGEWPRISRVCCSVAAENGSAAKKGVIVLHYRVSRMDRLSWLVNILGVDLEHRDSRLDVLPVLRLLAQRYDLKTVARDGRHVSAVDYAKSF